MKSRNQIETLIKNLQKERDLSVEEFSLGVETLNDISNHKEKLDEDISKFIETTNKIDLFWRINMSNSKIKALNLGSDIVNGEIKIDVDQIISSLDSNLIDELDDTFSDVLNQSNLDNRFLVIDNLYPNLIVGYIKTNDFIEDNLYLMVSLDDNIYNLSIGISEYIDYGYSCGFFTGWQMLFIDSATYDEDTKKLGYYVPQILPKEIHEPFMQKFKERFGEVTYKPEDYS